MGAHLPLGRAMRLLIATRSIPPDLSAACLRGRGLAAVIASSRGKGAAGLGAPC